MAEITPEIRPKVERDGTHWERFEFRLDGEVIATSRQPYFAGARALVARGVDGATLMRMHPDAEPFPLAYWARWTIEESDAGGLRRRKWRPMALEKRVVRSRAADGAPAGI